MPSFKGKMNAQHRRALDAWPGPLKKPLYPVIIERGAWRPAVAADAEASALTVQSSWLGRCLICGAAPGTDQFVPD